MSFSLHTMRRRISTRRICTRGRVGARISGTRRRIGAGRRVATRGRVAWGAGVTGRRISTHIELQNEQQLSLEVDEEKIEEERSMAGDQSDAGHTYVW